MPTYVYYYNYKEADDVSEEADGGAQKGEDVLLLLKTPFAKTQLTETETAIQAKLLDLYESYANTG